MHLYLNLSDFVSFDHIFESAGIKIIWSIFEHIIFSHYDSIKHDTLRYTNKKCKNKSRNVLNEIRQYNDLLHTKKIILS